MSDTLRDRAARAAKALDRRRDAETFEREFLRDHPTYADEYHRMKRKAMKVAGPAPAPAVQTELPGMPARTRKRRRR